MKEKNRRSRTLQEANQASHCFINSQITLTFLQNSRVAYQFRLKGFRRRLSSVA